MLKKANFALALFATGSFILSACSNSQKSGSSVSPTPLFQMTCDQLQQEMNVTQTALEKAKHTANKSMNINTGGSVGAYGGSSSGVSLGAVVGIGTIFGSTSKKRA